MNNDSIRPPQPDQNQANNDPMATGEVPIVDINDTAEFPAISVDPTDQPNGPEQWRDTLVDCYSHSLPKVEGHNKDVAFADETIGTAGVFDGIGNYATSETAAQTASEVLSDLLADADQEPPATRQAARELMTEYLDEAAAAVHDIPLEFGSGTTALIAKLYADEQGQYMAIGNIGDCRAYKLSTGLDGELEIKIITLDHDKQYVKASPVQPITSAEDQQENNPTFQTAMSLQQKMANAQDANSLTDEEKAIFATRNVISSNLGQAPAKYVDTYIEPVGPGDIILLTSDGVHDNLTTDQIRRIVQESSDPGKATEQLVNRARIFGDTARQGINQLSRAKADDTTAVLMRIP